MSSFQSLICEPSLKRSVGGYFYATYDGVYRFSLLNVDDAAMLWLGANAVSGWNASNSNLSVTFDYDRYAGGIGSVSVYINGGTYLPVRVAWWQGGGPGSLSWTITHPNGAVVVDSNTASPLLLRYSCDKLAGPVYQEQFGYEGPAKAGSVPAPCNNQGV